jgi:hypothetical protein
VGQHGETFSVASAPGTNYVWTLPAGLTIVSGQGTNSITVDVTSTVNGIVSVAGTNAFGSTTLSTAEQTSAVTAIDPTALSYNLRIFPNPSNGTLVIESNQKSTFNLLNELGVLVQQVELNDSNNFTQRITLIESGVFILLGESNGKPVREKVIVTK